MKNISKNNRMLLLCLLLIFFISLIVTLSNLGWHKSFIGDDVGISCHFPDKLIKFFYYTWNRLYAPGKTAVTNIFGFLWGNFIFGLFKLGFNPILIERLIYFLFFLISGLSSFFLLTLLLKKFSNITNKKAIYLGAFTGSLLYMLNHFTMHIASFPVGSYHLSYMLLPLILALFIYNLQIKTSFFSISLFLITFLFLLNGNPSNTLSIVFFLITYLLFFINQIKKSPTKPILFLTLSFVLILFLCSYIYLPIIGLKSNPYGKLAFTQDFINSMDFNSLRTSFLNLFRLAGLNTWPNCSHYNLYTQNVLFIFSGYLIPILAIASLFIRKGRKIKFFFGLVIVIVLFFAKGTHPPFEKIFLFVSSKIPYFEMYRAVYYKFVFYIALSYSVLIAFFISQSFCLLKKHYNGKIRYTVLLVPFIILLYNKPFFTKDVVPRDFLTVIPQEYIELGDVIKGDPADFKILSLPPAPGGRGLLLKWDNDNLYVGAYPDILFFNNSVLDSYWFITYKILPGTSWGDIKFEENVDSILDYTKLLNIKYIFLHKDFVERYDFKSGGGLKILNGKLRAKIIESIFKQQKDVELVEDSKYYTLYKLSNNYFFPHIYSATSLAFDDVDIDMLKITKEEPRITFKKINPTKYLVKVEGAKSPFWLVFSESFHKQWRLYQIPDTRYQIPDEIIAEYPNLRVKEARHTMRFTPEDMRYLFKKPLEAEHRLVNGYANGWYIEPDRLGEDPAFAIYFFPQSFFYLGLGISGLSLLLICLGYLGFSLCRRKSS